MLNLDSFFKFKKIKLIYVLHKKNVFSNLKIKAISNQNTPLPYQIKQPLFYFLNLLKNIQNKPADIT